MADDELTAIRAARLAQLKAQGSGGLSAAAPSKEQQSGASEEMKRTLLYQILSPEARERCILYYSSIVARIKIVKEQKANAVEEMIVKMAQSGQIREKVSEKQLIDLLEQLQDKSTKITILSKRFDDDDY
jgi:programmed cell death protein 5